MSRMFWHTPLCRCVVISNNNIAPHARMFYEHLDGQRWAIHGIRILLKFVSGCCLEHKVVCLFAERKNNNSSCLANNEIASESCQVSLSSTSQPCWSILRTSGDESTYDAVSKVATCTTAESFQGRVGTEGEQRTTLLATGIARVIMNMTCDRFIGSVW